MRDRCGVAIDQAGHEQVTVLASYPLPAEGGLRGAIKGDLQSVDAEGKRYCYYLRPQADRVLPKWLANLALASHGMSEVKLYVVAEEPSPEFQKSCRTAGAGLLELTLDDSFSHLLEYDELTPENPDAAFNSSVDEIRRLMEAKLEVNLVALQHRVERISEATQGMADDIAENYTSVVERNFAVWTKWGDDMSQRLDTVFAARDEASLALVRRDIEAGPILDDDQ